VRLQLSQVLSCGISRLTLPCRGCLVGSGTGSALPVPSPCLTCRFCCLGVRTALCCALLVCCRRCWCNCCAPFCISIPVGAALRTICGICWPTLRVRPSVPAWLPSMLRCGSRWRCLCSSWQVPCLLHVWHLVTAASIS